MTHSRGHVTSPIGPLSRCRCGGRLRCVGVYRERSQRVTDKLTALHGDLDAGIRRPDALCTVTQAVADWLAEGLDGWSEKTVAVNRHTLRPVVASIGKVPLRDMTTWDVRRVLMYVAATRSSRTVVVTQNALERVIRHAEANDYVRRNVATLVRPPAGQVAGRPSKSLTMDQAAALLAAAEGARLGPYVVLCLLAGVRTEEARALTWEHVDLEGDRGADRNLGAVGCQQCEGGCGLFSPCEKERVD